MNAKSLIKNKVQDILSKKKRDSVNAIICEQTVNYGVKVLFSSLPPNWNIGIFLSQSSLVIINDQSEEKYK